jgi:23S rRNA pseudouridine1911/1915/1917 synthase
MNQSFDLIYESEQASRLDKHITGINRPELYSRTLIEKLIVSGKVIVNDKVVTKKSYLLIKGDKITIELPEAISKDIVPQDIPLDIIFEDEYLAVINKPAGLIVHPGFGHNSNTMANAIAHRFGSNLPSSEGCNRPGIVHRLDKGTSGLVIIAKDSKTHFLLSGMFAKRQIKKTYLAISTGTPDSPEGTIETNYGRQKTNPRKMTVCKTGKLASTYYKTLRLYECFTLLEVGLETGRMHQIRVHLNYINLPVLGDTTYNSVERVQSAVPLNMRKKVMDLLSNHLQRQALHAWKLAFVHPITSEALELTAALPEDINYTLNWLEKYFAVDNAGYDKIML